MEIHIKQVDFLATTHDVTRAIATKLHAPEYTVSMPLNFHVRLFKDKKGRKQPHSGSGALTLPSIDIGQRFLERYGEQSSDSIMIRNRRLVLRPSNRNPAPEVVTSIQNSPYMDPELREQRERKEQILTTESVSIRQIQFGWECRDYVFSNEWEYDCPGATVSFAYEKRQMIIKLLQNNQPRQTNPLYDSEEIFSSADFLRSIFEVNLSDLIASEERIIIDFPKIDYMSAHFSPSGSVPIIFLSLTMPPIYLRAAPESAFSSLFGIQHEQPPQRLSSLSEDIDKLDRLLRISEASFHKNESYYPADRRKLFSRQALENFSSWVASDRIPFTAAFLLEKLLHDHSVDPCEMLDLRDEVHQLVDEAAEKGDDYLVSVLQEFGNQALNLFWNPDRPKSLLRCFKDVRRHFDKTVLTSAIPRDDDLFMCLHVRITPTSMFLEGPLPERTNRVIRSYNRDKSSHFIRVSFVDEGKLRLQYDRDIDLPAFVQNRLRPYLLHGLKLAGREFDFLAYSQSALKEHTVWYLRAFEENGVIVDVPAVIASLGNFADLPWDAKLMYCPARYTARISQGFTTTDPTTVEVENIREVDDIVLIDSQGTKWTATDGVGTISSDLALSLYLERQLRRGPNVRIRELRPCIQIRFMGSKGMLSPDHTLPKKTVCLRPSMIKFTGTSAKTIEIAKVFDKPGPMYLNRPLIILLEGLGVQYETFKMYQDMAVQDAKESTESLERAAHFLEGHGLGSSFRLPSVLLNLSKIQVPLPEDRFFDKMMEYAVNHVLRLLKHKARIPVPGAYNLVGVADIHQFLQPGQIFVCIKPVDGLMKYLEGPVLVSRSPTIHPGDIQCATAIGAPPPGSSFVQEPLANTVVFPTTGSRPLPSCLGGGDLDGDEYNVIPLNDLPEFLPTKFVDPSSYEPAQRKELDHPCQHEDVAHFVMDYITSDVLGYIAIAWRIIADQQGIFHSDCMKLAGLHSLAVDYPKSGRPVPMSDIPRRPSQPLPDWHAPETVTDLNPDSYYPSQRAIGKLFREIDLPATATVVGMGRAQRRQFNRERHTDEEIDNLVDSITEISFDVDPRSVPMYPLIKRRVEGFTSVDRMEFEPEYISELFSGYRSQLQSICSTHTLSHSRAAMLTEEEAVVGTIVAKTSQPRKRQDHTAKLREQTELLVRGVRDSLSGDEDVASEVRLNRAFFAFKFVAALRGNRSKFGASSFEWIALGAVFEFIREIEERDLEADRLSHRQRH